MGVGDIPKLFELGSQSDIEKRKAEMSATKTPVEPYDVVAARISVGTYVRKSGTTNLTKGQVSSAAFHIPLEVGESPTKQVLARK